MIVVRTPLRVSFAGGGTDIPAWYERETGAVTAAAIGAYVYITIGRHWERERVRLSYSTTEDVNSLDYLQHDLVREAIRIVGSGLGLEISSIAQIPGKGTGLGSSSSYTVGVLHALAALHGMKVSAGWLADRACAVELEQLKSPGGKQDQFAAAYGGIQYMTFNGQGVVNLHPIDLPSHQLSSMDRRLPLYWTNLTRRASDILVTTADRLRGSPQAKGEAKAMVGLAAQAREALSDGRLEELGEIMHESWERKKRISMASTPELNELYEKALKAGAIGGKLCGAGGGGFFVFYVPEKVQERVDEALKLRRINVRYGVGGSQVVYQDHPTF